MRVTLVTALFLMILDYFFPQLLSEASVSLGIFQSIFSKINALENVTCLKK